jgi:hypothetical protein
MLSALSSEQAEEKLLGSGSRKANEQRPPHTRQHVPPDQRNAALVQKKLLPRAVYEEITYKLVAKQK